MACRFWGLEKQLDAEVEHVAMAPGSETGFRPLGCQHVLLGEPYRGRVFFTVRPRRNSGREQR